MSDLRLKPALPGVALRRWRVLNRVKQSHAAELFRVTQSTISRWESGIQSMDDAASKFLESLLSARLDAAADLALARLVSENTRPVHLICDVSHRLLACSAARAAQFTKPVADLRGKSLWRFATPEIMQTEAALTELGWWDLQAPPALEFMTGPNDSDLVPIRDSLCRWTRISLSDGTAARLVETI